MTLPSLKRTAVEVATPASVSELQDLVARAAASGHRVKPIGAGHFDCGIGHTDGVRIRPDRLRGILRADRETGLVTVLAGTRLRELNEVLWQLGLALANPGDRDEHTVAGAISTGSHGTGARLAGIATQVRAIQLVLADGSLREVETDLLPGARIGLGALGAIATVSLQCEPAFALAASEASASLDDTLTDLETNVLGNDHFEFAWFPHTSRVLTKRGNRVLADAPLRPLGRVRRYLGDEFVSKTVSGAIDRVTSRRPSLVALGNAVAARARSPRDYIDRSYRVMAAPRRASSREMEYAVPRDAVAQVLYEVQAWLARSGERIGWPLEVRFAPADDAWLSTAYGRSTGYVAVHHHDPESAFFRGVEAIATSVDGRPHWGRVHHRGAGSLRREYPRFDDFVALRDALDPLRRFGNPYLTRVLGP